MAHITTESKECFRFFPAGSFNAVVWVGVGVGDGDGSCVGAETWSPFSLAVSFRCFRVTLGTCGPLVVGGGGARPLTAIPFGFPLTVGSLEAGEVVDLEAGGTTGKTLA